MVQGKFSRHNFLKICAGAIALTTGCVSHPLPYTGRARQTIESNSFYNEATKIIERNFPVEERIDLTDDKIISRIERATRYIYATGKEFPSEYTDLPFSIHTLDISEKEPLIYSVWHARNPITNKKEKTDKILIYLNGLESHSGWFSEIANELAEKSISIYAVDRRGSGLNSRLTGSWQEWIYDIDSVIQEAMFENMGKEVYLASLCFGSKLAAAYSIQNQDTVNGQIMISPGFNMNVGPNLFEKLGIVANRFLPLFSRRTKSPIREKDWFTQDPEGLNYIENDLLKTVAPSSEVFLQARDLDKYVRKNIHKMPKKNLLVFLSERDKIVDIGKTKKTLKKLKNNGYKIKIIEFPTENHTMFFTPEYKEEMVNEITNYIF